MSLTLDRAEVERMLDVFPAPSYLIGPFVYRARSDADLLYVGMSTTIRHRLRSQRTWAPWWPDMTRIDLEPHISRDEALRAEWRAIGAEDPAYNLLRPAAKRDVREVALRPYR